MDFVLRRHGLCQALYYMGLWSISFVESSTCGPLRLLSVVFCNSINVPSQLELVKTVRLFGGLSKPYSLEELDAPWQLGRTAVKRAELPS